MKKPKIIFLIGPTAVGKSEIAVYLGKMINGEIISCDSMQVYKGMDIITSKPSWVLRKRIPHHLIDIVSPLKEFNVYRYRKDASKKLRDITRRGKTPIFVGGTGLYMSIMLDGIFNAKSQNKKSRKRLYQEVKLHGKQYLYERLKNVDPQAASKIHYHDIKRIIRALEVFESTGKPISELQKQREGLGKDYEMKIFCLNIPRQQLYQRIAERIERMFKRGLVRETKELLKMKLSRTASCAIGIKELKGHFTGLYDLEEAKRLIKRNTRLYAKRQISWFSRDKRIKWVEVVAKEKPKAVAGRIYRML